MLWLKWLIRAGLKYGYNKFIGAFRNSFIMEHKTVENKEVSLLS